MNSLASLVDRTLVSHAPFQAAVREIETCFEFAFEASEPICVALIGPSRTGKSRVLDVCERQHPKVRREDGMYVPILRVTTPSKPTVKGLAEVLLEGMGAVDATRGTENERTRRVKYLMRNTGTRMLMIDEFQHFFDKGTKLIMHHVADWLKILVDETRCALVVAGLPSCQTVIDSNEQLAGRFHAPILMPRFSWQDVEQREEFIGILQAFHQVLSQHFQTPEFHRRANWIPDEDLAAIGVARGCVGEKGDHTRRPVQCAREGRVVWTGPTVPSKTLRARLQAHTD